MARFSDAQLRQKALAVLEDAAQRANKGKLGDEPALAFTLAWLANECEDRGLFDWFFQSRTIDDLGRCQNMNAALNGIYLAVGEKRW